MSLDLFAECFSEDGCVVLSVLNVFIEEEHSAVRFIVDYVYFLIR